MCLQLNAQTCIQTFTASGQDSGPTVLTINSADITCNGANPISSLKLTNAAGSLTSFYCSTDGTEWFGFNLSIDGGAPITGCASTFKRNAGWSNYGTYRNGIRSTKCKRDTLCDS